MSGPAEEMVVRPDSGNAHGVRGADTSDLLRMFSPRSIAVVGATDDPKKYGSRPLRNLIATNFSGTLYPVNPNASKVQGRTAYPSLSALPEVPDLVMIAVGAAAVAGVLAGAGERGCRAAIVHSGGFKEAGNENGEAELARIADDYGICLLGPNCTGLVNFSANVAASSSLIFADSPEFTVGDVAVVSQSGGMGLSIIRACLGRIGLSYYASVGNEATVSAADLAEALIDDPAVATVALYCESIADGRRLLRIADKAAAAGKRLVVLKVGATDLGRKLAQTHTGALTSAADVVRSAFRDSSAIYTESLADFVDVLSVPDLTRLGSSKRLLVMSPSGGFAVIAADTCEQESVGLAKLGPESVHALEKLLPPVASVATNPVDMTPVSGRYGLAAAAEALRRPEVDSLLLILPPEQVPAYADELSGLGAQAAAGGKAAILALAGVDALPSLGSDLMRRLTGAGLALFGDPVRAVRTVALTTRSRSGIADAGQLPEAAVPAAGLWRPEDAQAHVARYGIVVPRQEVVTSLSEAVQAASRIGYPLVAKAIVAGLSHKTEARAVRTGIADAGELTQVLEEMIGRLGAGPPAADPVCPPTHGGPRFLLQQQVVGPSAELLIGVTRDRAFGPVLTVGSGGVLANLLADVSTGLPPEDREQAAELLRRTKIYEVLRGYRGLPPLDIGAALDAIVAVGAAGRDPMVDSIELNPLIVTGQGAIAVDVRMIGSRRG